MDKKEIFKIIKQEFSISDQIWLIQEVSKIISKEITEVKKSNQQMNRVIDIFKKTINQDKAHIMNTRIDGLHFSVRLKNSLKCGGYVYVKDIINNIEKVRALPNFGSMVAKELHNYLFNELNYFDENLAKYKPLNKNY